MVPPEPPTWCPRCGAAYEPLQEYCLECGERLPTSPSVIPVLAAAWRRHIPWYPGDWVWPLVVFFLLSVVSTAAAVAAASSKSSTIVATQPGVTVGPGATTTVPTATLPPAPQPTITTGPLPTAPGNSQPGTVPTAPATTAPAPPAPTTTPATAAGSWPTGRNGYTNVLESIPVSAGRGRAEAQARRAAAAGLPQTGVIDSSRFSSLHDGFYVVFSGVYSTATQAAAALAQAHARGFPDAYEARVTQ